jgi:hypothetical protein
MGRYRKNVKRIDPRYFLEETVNRGEELEIPAAGSSTDRRRRNRGELEEGTEPKDESILRALWDLFTTPTASQRELDPVHSERDLDRRRDAEQAKKDMARQRHAPVPDAPETYGRPHALKTRVSDEPVTEGKDSPPPALARWIDLFPKAAEALVATMSAFAGAEIPGLVKHDRTPEERLEDRAQLAQSAKERGPRPPSTWGKFEEGK